MKISILMTLLRGSSLVSHRNIKTLASLLTAKSIFVPRSNDANQKEIESMSEFINRSSRLFVITGAGVSTESGIRDYRSEGVGLYATSTQRPIEFQDFLKYPLRRQRYWARNFAGWPLFSSFPPNITHEMLADMEHYGNLHWLVTQNVDSLHKKAGSTKLTELHGSGARYVKVFGTKYSRMVHINFFKGCLPQFFLGPFLILSPICNVNYPVDVGHKLNVHKTFIRLSGRLLNALYTFYSRVVPKGQDVEAIML